MAIEIKDLSIMDCEIGAKEGNTTYIPSQSMVESKNSEFNIKLEKQLVNIGSHPCECFQPKVSVLTNKVGMPSQEELVNSYEYGAIVIDQADIRTDTKCIIRRCKNCGKVSLFGDMDYFIGSLSLMLGSAVDSMETTSLSKDDEIVEVPIEDNESTEAPEKETENA